MPAWVLGLKLAMGMLAALQPDVQAALDAAVASGQDSTPHQTALAEITNALTCLANALAVAAAAQ